MYSIYFFLARLLRIKLYIVYRSLYAVLKGSIYHSIKTQQELYTIQYILYKI